MSVEKEKARSYLKKTTGTNQLLDIYSTLFSCFGPQHWWPGASPFEVAVGAILTQNTAWRNVEHAISNLKNTHNLNPFNIYEMPIRILASLIRPAGFFNVKARRLKAFAEYLTKRYQGDMENMCEEKKPEWLREELLMVHGIGPETADSILLYAGNIPTFVVDAYTRRIFTRHEFFSQKSTYEEIRKTFTRNLPKDVILFKEYHALIVKLGKEYCRNKPFCANCPLSYLYD